MSLTLVLQVVGGAVLGFALLWLFALVGTRLTEHRTEQAISALQARMEINAIRRQAVRRLFDIADGRDGVVRPSYFRARFLDPGDEER